MPTRSHRRGFRLPILVVVIALLMLSLQSEAKASTGPGAAEGARQWTARFDGPADGPDVAQALAVSPDGSMVFVAGYSSGISSGHDYTTVAYDAATGDRIWLAKFQGAGQSLDEASALAVSPDGSVVFVTGYGGLTLDYITIAYDAATGTRLWARRYDGPSHFEDMAHAIALSPDGSMVFVTGESSAVDADYATIAYEATTGAQLWVARYAGPGVHYWDIAKAIGVSPDGSKVFVTGASTERGGSTYYDYATLGYDAVTGQQLWLRRYDGGSGDDAAYALGVSPDGSAVFVTGYTDNKGIYLTIAYETATGARLWSSTLRARNGVAVPYSLGVSPDGSTVFVTGQNGEYGAADLATIAYDANTGTRLWGSLYDGPTHYGDVGNALSVSPDGSTVFVAGYSGDLNVYDFVTLAYDAANGDELWAQLYDGPGQSLDIAHAIGVSPDGSAVYVSGESGEIGNADFLTVAYST